MKQLALLLLFQTTQVSSTQIRSSPIAIGSPYIGAAPSIYQYSGPITDLQCDTGESNPSGGPEDYPFGVQVLISPVAPNPNPTLYMCLGIYDSNGVFSKGNWAKIPLSFQ